ncbi:hypothetical protein GBZ26_28025 [Azospirillum formosense]|uniref:Anti-sigma factor RsiW n=1 Tax=Azospirillum formosense TaxID=861533 RepID=A0ABX2L785_9PROT|nr:hypothetical protein [Azospirillum formosense]MBY3755799.1 hypothetical protein [Azospirillum formosense]MBY3756399.1 hypothetical protein [Azospirillum formosense]NUB22994.1 hypothetical protein [Azospirillum formosense]
MGGDPISLHQDTDLHLYMDGEMEPARRAAFEAQLAANPALAAKLNEYRHQQEMLKLGLDMMAAVSVQKTETLAGRLRWRLDMDRFSRRVAPLAAAMLLVMGGWSLTVWVQSGGAAGPQLAGEVDDVTAFADEAAEAHSKAVALNTLQPSLLQANITPVPAQTAQVPLPEGSGMTVALPAIGPELTLIRASVVPWNHGTALQFLYREPDGELLTLFVASGGPARDGALHTVVQDSLRLVYWRAGLVAYTVAGNKADGDLLTVAKKMADSIRRS